MDRSNDLLSFGFKMALGAGMLKVGSLNLNTLVLPPKTCIFMEPKQEQSDNIQVQTNTTEARHCWEGCLLVHFQTNHRLFSSVIQVLLWSEPATQSPACMFRFICYCKCSVLFPLLLSGDKSTKSTDMNHSIGVLLIYFVYTGSE